jgi:hypothetical protein
LATATQALPPLAVQFCAALSAGHSQAVAAAYDEIKGLLILLKVDMTNVLGVTVDFSDNDGD